MKPTQLQAAHYPSRPTSPDPNVTFLMTAYNASEFIEEAIDSIIAQTHPEWWLLALDNGSTDDTAQIISRYSRIDPRVKLVRLATNLGRTPALNYGLNLVTTQWVACLDADDVSLPDRIALQLAYLEDHPGTVVVGAWADFIDEAGHLTGVFRPPSSPSAVRRALCTRAVPIAHSAATYSTQAALAVGGYPNDLEWASDVGLWARLAQIGQLELVPKPLVRIRLHRNQGSRTTTSLLKIEETLAVHATLADGLGLEGRDRVAWKARGIRLHLRRISQATLNRRWYAVGDSCRSVVRTGISDPASILVLGSLLVAYARDVLTRRNALRKRHALGKIRS